MKTVLRYMPEAVLRVSDDQAAELVKTGKALYVSKAVHKALTRPNYKLPRHIRNQLFLKLYGM